MKKTFPIMILVLGIAFTGFGCTERVDTTGFSNAPDEPVVEEVAEQDMTRSYTFAEVARHGTKGDCWLIIHGQVYDVSEYEMHPGGAALLQGCGQDATRLFESRPMGSGTPHSDTARGFLADFLIGELE